MSRKKSAEVKIAIELATLLAESAKRLRFFEENNAPQNVLQKEREVNQKLREKIKKYPLADELYFQARLRDKYTEERRRFIAHETILGKLIATLIDSQKNERDMVNQELREVLNDKQVSDSLSRVSADKQQGLTSEDLLRILSLIAVDLQFMKKDLPPAPPKFVLPEYLKDRDE